MATDAVAFLQNPWNEPQSELHVMAASPLYARYITSVATAPAAIITYVNACMRLASSQNGNAGFV